MGGTHNIRDRYVSSSYIVATPPLISNPGNTETEVIQSSLCSCYHLESSVRDTLPPHIASSPVVIIKVAVYGSICRSDRTGIISYPYKFERQYLELSRHVWDGVSKDDNYSPLGGGGGRVGRGTQVTCHDGRCNPDISVDQG